MDDQAYRMLIDHVKPLIEKELEKNPTGVVKFCLKDNSNKYKEVWEFRKGKDGGIEGKFISH